MAELTLHFEVSPGTDPAAVAAALQQAIAQASGVKSADTKAQHFQAITGQEVLSVIQFATSVATSAAAFLGSVAAVYAAWQKVKGMFPGVHAPTVEVGLKKVPIDQLTAEHLDEAADN